MSKPESAIIIVNSSVSALEILADISKFTRAFASRPIRLLRCDNADHVDVIRALQAKYNITSVPAMIAKDGSVIIGKSRIRDFIPKLARLVSRIADAERANAQKQRIPIGRRLARYSKKDDEDDAEEDDPKRSRDAIGKKIADYYAAMAARGARIGVRDDGAGPRGPTPGPAAPPAQHHDQIDEDDAPRAQHGAPPPPPQGGKAVIDDAMFDDAMMQGIQADLDADALVSREFDAERAVRDLVLKG